MCGYLLQSVLHPHQNPGPLGPLCAALDGDSLLCPSFAWLPQLHFFFRDPHVALLPQLATPLPLLPRLLGMSQGSVLYTHFHGELIPFHGFIYKPLANNLLVYVSRRNRRSCASAYSIPIMASEPEGGKLRLRSDRSQQRATAFLHSSIEKFELRAIPSLVNSCWHHLQNLSRICQHLVCCHHAESGPAAGSQLLSRSRVPPALHGQICTKGPRLNSATTLPAPCVLQATRALSLRPSRVLYWPLHLLFLVPGALCPVVFSGRSREAASRPSPYAVACCFCPQCSSPQRGLVCAEVGGSARGLCAAPHGPALPGTGGAGRGEADARGARHLTGDIRLVRRGLAPSRLSQCPRPALQSGSNVRTNGGNHRVPRLLLPGPCLSGSGALGFPSRLRGPLPDSVRLGFAGVQAGGPAPYRPCPRRRCAACPAAPQPAGGRAAQVHTAG